MACLDAHLYEIEYMLFGAKMVVCALAGLSASLRSAANLPAAAHKTSFLLLIT
jgi:hypothetical protein